MKTKTRQSDPRTAQQKRRRLGGWVCNAAATLLLLAVVAVCLPLTLPRALGMSVYHVVSGSMEPAIPTGSVVMVQYAEPSTLEPGTVIAYRRAGSGNTLVIHRLVQNNVVEGELITQGDANAEPDMEPVDYGEALGRVVFHLPFIGLYAGALSTLLGKLYALGFVVAALMLYALAGRLKELSQPAAPKAEEAGEAPEAEEAPKAEEAGEAPEAEQAP